MAKGIGDRFQEETKHRPDRMEGGALDWTSQPSPYKEYPDAERIELVIPGSIQNMTLDDTIHRRRSVRSFTGEPMALEQLSYLLWASGGIQRSEHGFQFRCPPSAGALYPVETYVIANSVDGLERGLYHYPAKDHVLELLKKGDLRREISRAALDQEMCGQSCATVIWTGIFQRSRWKYRQRSYRYVYMDAGHVGAHLSLAAVSVGLGSCQVGAFYDDEVNRIIGVDGEEESAIYMSVVGRPA
jgi:SagB-type dehydrogenase family enzyme